MIRDENLIFSPDRMLQIIDQFEEFIFCISQLCGLMVGNAKHFHRVIEYAAFNIIILYAADFNASINTFKLL